LLEGSLLNYSRNDAVRSPLKDLSAREDTKSKLTVSIEEDSDNQSIDTKNTSHDNGDDGLEEEFWLQNDGAADANSRLGSSVGGTEVSEDKGGCDAHISEECVLVAIVV